MGGGVSLPELDSLPADLSLEEAVAIAGVYGVEDEGSLKAVWAQSAVDGRMPRMEFMRHAERLSSVYWNQRAKFHTKIDPTDAAAVAAAVSDAARAIADADAILITTGAGMGVDMGLADFRSSNAFWEGLHHPEIQRYEDFSDSKWFERDPELAWGINFAQTKAYREAPVHAGYDALRRMVQLKGDEYFCWTSNVDGVLQRAGFDPRRVREVHGNIHRLQCTQKVQRRSILCSTAAGTAIAPSASGSAGAGGGGASGGDSAPPPPSPPPPCLWKSQEPWDTKQLVEIDLDPTGSRAVSQLPKCTHCGALARPNLWFCKDANYIPSSQGTETNSRYTQWLESCAGKRVVVIECGGGLAIPSVRVESEDIAEQLGAVLVRLNPSDFGVPAAQEGGSPRAIGIPLGSAAGLVRLLGEVEARSAKGKAAPTSVTRAQSDTAKPTARRRPA
jgi:NAD-dependent SIR2 family protein deacetylase